MRKLWLVLIPLVVCGAAIGGLLVSHREAVALGTEKPAAEAAKDAPTWLAAAPGRVEPKGGEVSLSFLMPGTVKDVLARMNDHVKAGDLLVRLDDEEVLAKLTVARNEVSLRQRDRDDDGVTGLALDRRKAEDAVYNAEQDLFQARLELDRQVTLLKRGSGGDGAEAEKAREAIKTIQDRLDKEQANLRRVRASEKLPPISRKEAALAAARVDVTLLQIGLDKGRIRAPFDGTVLQVHPKAGEAVALGADSGVIGLGNTDHLQVRVEVDERDASKIAVGQTAMVKAAALRNRSFQAHVREVAPVLASPQLATRSPRKASDVDVLEVVLDLDETAGLIVGMRTDVYFGGGAPQPKTAEAKVN